jgi:hypothetical protein
MSTDEHRKEEVEKGVVGSIYKVLRTTIFRIEDYELKERVTYGSAEAGFIGDSLRRLVGLFFGPSEHMPLVRS